MGFVQRKSTTAKSKFNVKNFVAKKDISSWTMEQRGMKRVKMVGQNDKHQITAVFCGTLQGDFLPLQVIYKGKTACCHPHYEFPPGWHITHSPNHWSTKLTMLQYIENIIKPYVRSVRDLLDTVTTPGLIIMDNFKGQVTEKVSSLLEKCNLHVCL